MITGPGQAERSVLPGNPRVMSIAQFWHHASSHVGIAAERVAVIGGGETAASMLNELFRHRVYTITVISPSVTRSPAARASSRTRCSQTRLAGPA